MLILSAIIRRSSIPFAFRVNNLFYSKILQSNDFTATVRVDKFNIINNSKKQFLQVLHFSDRKAEPPTTPAENYKRKIVTEKMENKTEPNIAVNKEELKKRLTPMQYQVTQEAATERPFTGCYNKHYEKGIYQCIVCHQDLFSSDTKYDAGCGWPAFNDVLDQGKVTLHRDASIPGMVRTEVRCSKCSAHMGHVFDDGPSPTRRRYCINSASIDFVPKATNSNQQNQSQQKK